MATETTKYQKYNPATRKHEDIDPRDMMSGDEVVKLFYCESRGRWMTIPGESRFKVSSQRFLVLIDEHADADDEHYAEDAAKEEARSWNDRGRS